MNPVTISRYSFLSLSAVSMTWLLPFYRGVSVPVTVTASM